MEASALPVPAAIARSRLAIGSSLLRLRSDEQLVALFRAGNEDAFLIIHERYHQRVFAYARQMLPGSRQDAEDALQDIFVRAYAGLRASDRALALRAWLYRVAHNRCVDELRRPSPPPPELLNVVRPPAHDPIAEAERRESLRALIADIRRLPEQQRSALLMRELGGMAYADLASALGVSVPAVKSLLVRARIGLAQSADARETACFEIRRELVLAHDRGVRPSGLARRHLHECAACRAFRAEMRNTSRQLAAIVPLGPLGVLANLFGFGSGAAGGGAAGSGAAGSGAAAAGGVLGTGGAVGAIGAFTGGSATHVAVIAAAVVTAGGAIEIQHTIAASSSRPKPEIAPAALVSPPELNPANGARSAASSAQVAGAQSPLTPTQVAAASAAIAGPALPAVDRINPAQAATSLTAAASSTTTAPSAVTSQATSSSSKSSSSGGTSNSPSSTGSGSASGTSGTGSTPLASASPPGSGGSSSGSATTPSGSSSSPPATGSSTSTDTQGSSGALATPASASASGSGQASGSGSGKATPPPSPPQG